jgi:hypothetical protein
VRALCIALLLALPIAAAQPVADAEQARAQLESGRVLE